MIGVATVPKIAGLKPISREMDFVNYYLKTLSDFNFKISYRLIII